MILEYNSGFLLATTPIKRPPAEPPYAWRLFALVYLFSIKNFEQSIKSLNVFHFFKSFPFSYQSLPKYSLPLIWEIA